MLISVANTDEEPTIESDVNVQRNKIVPWSDTSDESLRDLSPAIATSPRYFEISVMKGRSKALTKVSFTEAMNEDVIASLRRIDEIGCTDIDRFVATEIVYQAAKRNLSLSSYPNVLKGITNSLKDVGESKLSVKDLSLIGYGISSIRGSSPSEEALLRAFTDILRLKQHETLTGQSISMMMFGARYLDLTRPSTQEYARTLASSVHTVSKSPHIMRTVKQVEIASICNSIKHMQGMSKEEYELILGAVAILLQSKPRKDVGFEAKHGIDEPKGEKTLSPQTISALFKPLIKRLEDGKTVGLHDNIRSLYVKGVNNYLCDYTSMSLDELSIRDMCQGLLSIDSDSDIRRCLYRLCGSLLASAVKDSEGSGTAIVRNKHLSSVYLLHRDLRDSVKEERMLMDALISILSQCAANGGRLTEKSAVKDLLLSLRCILSDSHDDNPRLDARRLALSQARIRDRRSKLLEAVIALLKASPSRQIIAFDIGAIFQVIRDLRQLTDHMDAIETIYGIVAKLLQKELQPLTPRNLGQTINGLQGIRGDSNEERALIAAVLSLSRIVAQQLSDQSLDIEGTAVMQMIVGLDCLDVAACPHGDALFSVVAAMIRPKNRLSLSEKSVEYRIKTKLYLFEIAAIESSINRLRENHKDRGLSEGQQRLLEAWDERKTANDLQPM